MIEEQWMNLKIGDSVDCIDSVYAKNLVVAEICEDERSLRNWWSRGYSEAKRLCKMCGNDGYLTWDVDFKRWNFSVIEE